MARVKKKAGGWQSARDEARVGTLTRLRAEFQQSSGAIITPARELLKARQNGFAAKALTLGEMLVDLSVSPVGRVVTATLALLGAWALL